MTTIARTIDDIGRLVQLLAVATRDTTIRPHRASNLVQPALLVQLRSAIVPDGVSSSGGGKAAHERIVINAAALDLYDFVTGRIEQLYTQATDRDPHGSPEEMLTMWLVAAAMQVADHNLNDAQIETAYDRLDDIRTRIMDLFHPPEAGPVEVKGQPARCPECGWSRVPRATPDGEISSPALVMMVRPWRGESAVQCRKCAHTWTGRDELNELAGYLGITLPTTAQETPA